MEILKRRRDKVICTIFGKDVVRGADILALLKKCGDNLATLVLLAISAIIVLGFIGFITLLVGCLLMPVITIFLPQIGVMLTDYLHGSNNVMWLPLIGLAGSLVGAIIFGILYGTDKLICAIIKSFSEIKFAEYHRKP